VMKGSNGVKKYDKEGGGGRIRAPSKGEWPQGFGGVKLYGHSGQSQSGGGAKESGEEKGCVRASRHLH